MRHPKYNCPECGHRLYAHVDGGTFCPECGYYFDPDDGGEGDEAGAIEGDEAGPAECAHPTSRDS